VDKLKNNRDSALTWGMLHPVSNSVKHKATGSQTFPQYRKIACPAGKAEKATVIEIASYDEWDTNKRGSIPQDCVWCCYILSLP
jgi:hypothetical protein